MTKVPRATIYFLALAGCADHPAQPGGASGQPDDNWENMAPVLRVVSPGQIAVGDDILFVGSGFIDPEHGQAKVRFVGWFTNDAGQTEDVDFAVTPTWVNGGQMSWRLGPNVVFDPSGERIGTFAGQIVAVNEPYDTDQHETFESQSMDAQLEVTPSILLRSLRPEGSACANVVDATIEGAPLELVADVIGLAPGEPGWPLVVTYQFIAPQMVVGFEGDTLNGHPIDQNPTPDDLLGQAGATAFDQVIEDGSTQLALGARWRTRVDVGGETRYLALFRAGALAQPANEQEILFNLTARDSGGSVAHRAVRLMIRRVAWLAYDGNQQLAERYQPTRVSACTPGAPPATEVQYSETSAEVRTRSLSFNWNYSVADSLGFSTNFGLPPWNPFFLNVGANVNRTWSEGFGMDVAASVSTEMSEVQGLSGQIYTGEFGVFYRQTERLTRLGLVSGSNECGVVGDLGNALLTDWAWAAELAKGRECPPRTRLPDAEVFE